MSDYSAKDYFSDFEVDEPTHSPLTSEQKKEQARTYRDIFKKPQMQQLDRKLDTARDDYKSQLGRTQANYQRQYNMLAEREQDQRRHDLDSAISRRAGRSGVVDYLNRERGKEYARQYSDLSHQEAAEADSLARELQRIKRQVPEQREQLAEQAARIEAQELQRLRDLDFKRRLQSAQEQYQRMFNVFDRTQLTPVEQLQLYAQLAGVKGEFPDDVPDIFGRFGVE